MNDDQTRESKLDQIRREIKARGEQKPEASTNIIHNLADAMRRKAENVLETPADLIKEQIEKNKLLIGKGPQQVAAAGKKKDDIELPPPPPIPPIIIDGHEFHVSNNQYLDAVLVLMYILAEVLSDNPRVTDILNQFKFSFSDNKGNRIFPKAPKTKKTKKHNARPSK